MLNDDLLPELWSTSGDLDLSLGTLPYGIAGSSISQRGSEHDILTRDMCEGPPIPDEEREAQGEKGDSAKFRPEHGIGAPISARKLADDEVALAVSSPDAHRYAPPMISLESGEGGPENRRLLRTLTMGKGAYEKLPQPITVDGKTYGYMVWKGIIGSREAPNFVRSVEGESKVYFPFGEERAFPFMIIDRGESMLLRFAGAEYYADLLSESRGSKIAESLKVRSPKLVMMAKFTKEFCQKHDLPVPTSDEPADAGSEDLSEFAAARVEEGVPAETIQKASELLKESSPKESALGESARLIRNPYRVEDLVQTMNIPDEEVKQVKLQEIITVSVSVLKDEFPTVASEQDYLTQLSHLLGEQTAKLWNGECAHRGLKEHTQNISLAAELCDWDTAVRMGDLREHFRDSPGLPLFEDEFKRNAMYEFFYVAGHMKKVQEAIEYMQKKEIDDSPLIASYVNSTRRLKKTYQPSSGGERR